MERTNTGGFALFPEGTYLFTVTQAPEKFRTETGKIRYVWRFNTTIEGRPKAYRESFMAWMLKPLLKALECQEVVSDEFEWEPDEQVGKIVWGTIVHEPDRKNPDKKWARMTDIQSTKEKAQIEEEKEGIPF